MRYCDDCGATYDDEDWDYCPKCGQHLNEPAEIIEQLRHDIDDLNLIISDLRVRNGQLLAELRKARDALIENADDKFLKSLTERKDDHFLESIDEVCDD